MPHISLVFREMWDTTNLDGLCQWCERFQVCNSGIPHLAKNERDMGHPTLRCQERFSGETFLALRCQKEFSADAFLVLWFSGGGTRFAYP